ncbi:hypothetical protein SBRCBS47491_005875 [Sporothrix bragantina]|uniref:2EXR domain-containing protein n=1 Tax=Sporothrix bragantina TaxID=671064 RepID=A0ABP0C2C9_9PEZI
MGALQDTPVTAVMALESTDIDQEHEQHAQDTAENEASSTTPAIFHKFLDLPTELRLKIWQCSFVPRVVEVHRRKSHYADDRAARDFSSSSSSAKWQSWSANPPALAVCYEARALALAHYCATIRLAVNTPCERAGEVRLDSHRRLYLAPHVDTLVVLGEFHVAQTAELLKHIHTQARGHAHNNGRGLRRLALSASSIGHPGSGILLQIYGRTIFQDLDTLVLFMYNAQTPPAAWSDGHMALVDCRDTYQYRYFRAGQGAELRAKRSEAGGASDEGAGPTEWITVGRGPLEVLDLAFGEEAETVAVTATRTARAHSAEDKPRLQSHLQTGIVDSLSPEVAAIQDHMAWISFGR